MTMVGRVHARTIPAWLQHMTCSASSKQTHDVSRASQPQSTPSGTQLRAYTHTKQHTGPAGTSALTHIHSSAAVCQLCRQRRSNIHKSLDPVWCRRTPSLLRHTQANNGCLPLPLEQKIKILPSQRSQHAVHNNFVSMQVRVYSQDNWAACLYSTGGRWAQSRHVCPACQQLRQKNVLWAERWHPLITPAHARALRTPPQNTFTARQPQMQLQNPVLCTPQPPQHKGHISTSQEVSAKSGQTRPQLRQASPYTHNHLINVHTHAHTDATNLLTQTHIPYVSTYTRAQSAQHG